jgi:hypothetical protein
MLGPERMVVASSQMRRMPEMEIKRYLFGDESAVLTNEYFAAFIEGARQFFLEGAPKI